MTSPLCHTFIELAEQTWRRIDAANRAGLFWGEETNTETILLTLMERHPRQVVVKAFNKHEEAANGADWEWWIGRTGEWLGMRVQAKRIWRGSETFRRMLTKPAGKGPESQMDCLIRMAAEDQLIPAYCFYIFTRRPVWSRWRDPSKKIPNPQIFGCALAHAQAVQRSNSEKLESLLPVCFPWHWLVCQIQPQLPADPLNPFRLSLSSVPSQFEFAFEDPGEALLPGPRQSLPHHVLALLEDGDLEGAGDVAAYLRERELAGVVLIRTSPEREEA